MKELGEFVEPKISGHQVPDEEDNLTTLEASKSTVRTVDEYAFFVCPHSDCKTRNGTMWRSDGDNEFLICGKCNRVMEVRK